MGGFEGYQTRMRCGTQNNAELADNQATKVLPLFNLFEAVPDDRASVEGPDSVFRRAKVDYLRGIQDFKCFSFNPDC